MFKCKRTTSSQFSSTLYSSVERRWSDFRSATKDLGEFFFSRIFLAKHVKCEQAQSSWESPGSFYCDYTHNNKLLENQIKIKQVYNLCRIWLCVIDFAPLGLTMIVWTMYHVCILKTCKIHKRMMIRFSFCMRLFRQNGFAHGLS